MDCRKPPWPGKTSDVHVLQCAGARNPRLSTQQQRPLPGEAVRSRRLDIPGSPPVAKNPGRRSRLEKQKNISVDASVLARVTVFRSAAISPAVGRASCPPSGARCPLAIRQDAGATNFKGSYAATARTRAAPPHFAGTRPRAQASSPPPHPPWSKSPYDEKWSAAKDEYVARYPKRTTPHP